MSRSDQRRRRALRAVAPVAGLLAVGLLVWQGSYAAFSAQSNNTGNAWASGSLTLTNDGGTGAYATTPFNTTGVFNEALIKPLDTRTRCLTVKTGGSAGGNLVFYRGTVGGSAPLALQIGLTIVQAPVSAVDLGVTAACGNFPAAGTTTIANNTALSALPSTYATGLGSTAVPAGVRFVAYKFTYTFNSTASDNTLQSTNTNADFSWEIQ